MYVCVSVQLSESSEFSLWEYLLTTRPGIGWVKGTASVTGVVLQVFICLMVLCSSTFVRRSGHFEVSSKTCPGATDGEQRPQPDEPDEKGRASQKKQNKTWKAIRKSICLSHLKPDQSDVFASSGASREASYWCEGRRLM